MTIALPRSLRQLTAGRARDISIRVSHGATTRDVVALILAQAARFTLTGVALGAAVAPIVLRVARGLLFGVGPFDLVSLTAVGAPLTAVSLAAATPPALRAASSDGTRPFI